MRVITPEARRALNKELGDGKDVNRIGWLSGLHRKQAILTVLWATRKERAAVASETRRLADRLERNQSALDAMEMRIQNLETGFASRDEALCILSAALSECVVAGSDLARLRIAREARVAVLEAGAPLPSAGAPE